MLQLCDPLLVDCPDCGAEHALRCYTDPARFCVGRGHLLARVALGAVVTFEINEGGQVREWSPRRMKGEKRVRKPMSPITCTACGQQGHNMRNPRCPAKTVLQ
jgi:predicted RNA-binding Zn-ribbon protein involved in translation (DUF1610 family)